MNRKDAFGILGLSLNASKEDIKRAYRKQAKIYHPDKNNDEDAISRFIEISEAYEILTESSLLHK